jgi:hypothetical protein
MIRGACLCGAVKFEVERFVGPFELCHCSRCRKASGSAFMAMIGVDAADFRWISGRDEIVAFEAPVIEYAPGYRSAFCRHCGSPMPVQEDGDEWFEIAAGVLDDDPGLLPDRHIFVDSTGNTDNTIAWHEITDDLPQLTKRDLIRMRIAEMKRGSKVRTNDSDRGEGEGR